MKLYELSAELDAILDQADADTGELPPDAAEALDTLSLQFAAKAEDCAKAILNRNAEAEALRVEIMRLEKRRDALCDQTQWLKDYLLAELDHAGIDHIDGELLKVRAQRNSAASVTITDEGAVPDAFKRAVTEVKIDRKAIADAIKAGQEVPGATAEYGKHLRIR